MNSRRYDYFVEYASSGKAVCQTCSNVIMKDALRIAFKTKGPKVKFQFMHLDCLPNKRVESELGLIQNWEMLRYNDQIKLMEMTGTSVPNTPKERISKEISDVLWEMKDQVSKTFKNFEVDKMLAIMRYNKINVVSNVPKKFLIHWLSDGLVFGLIGPCPMCHENTLFFDGRKYICQGSPESMSEKKCNFEGFDGVKRLEWRNPPGIVPEHFRCPCPNSNHQHLLQELAAQDENNNNQNEDLQEQNANDKSIKKGPDPQWNDPKTKWAIEWEEWIGKLENEVKEQNKEVQDEVERLVSRGLFPQRDEIDRDCSDYFVRGLQELMLRNAPFLELPACKELHSYCIDGGEGGLQMEFSGRSPDSVKEVCLLIGMGRCSENTFKFDALVLVTNSGSLDDITVLDSKTDIQEGEQGFQAFLDAISEAFLAFLTQCEFPSP